VLAVEVALAVEAVLVDGKRGVVAFGLSVSTPPPQPKIAAIAMLSAILLISMSQFITRF